MVTIGFEVEAIISERIPFVMNSLPSEYNKIFFEKESKEDAKGLGFALRGLVGTWKRRSSVVGKMQGLVDECTVIAEELAEEKDSAIKRQIEEQKNLFILKEETPEGLSAMSLALVYEAARRELGMTPFSVQMLAVIALSRGYLAELDTGEGKTLSIAMAAALSSWSGDPVHVITANDYLASRDAKLMRPLFNMLGVSVSHVVGESSPPERREAYAAMVTYTTAKEVAADYLRDKIALNDWGRSAKRHFLVNFIQGDEPRTIQRGLHRAFIDEADNCLIDEAVTPLIISQDQGDYDLSEVCNAALAIADKMTRGVDYLIVSRSRSIKLLPSAKKKMLHELGFPDIPIWKCQKRKMHMVQLALEANHFFKLGEQYIIEADKIVIVDESTGRPMPNRSWKMGLHQMVEAKEEVEITNPTQTVAQISFQSFFRKYGAISGATGTASEISSEVWHTYGMSVVKIPRNMPNMREHKQTLFFDSVKKKEKAILQSVRARVATGQPVLIGTRSVKASERLNDLFEDSDVFCDVLNARKLNDEAKIISEAGKMKRLTIATNMAGRGTDIKLGYGVKDLGGIHVVTTEPHESRRVDRQLFGRAARQGDPGSTSAFYSLTDDLFSKNLPSTILYVFKRLLLKNSSQGKRSYILRFLMFLAQIRAESLDRARRKSVSEEEEKMKAGLGFAGDR